MSCKWDDTSTYSSKCQEKGCWSYTTVSNCAAQPRCNWKTYISSGWCQEVECYNWDSWNGGNASSCVNNSNGLSCSWTGNPAGNTTNGWCYKNITTTASCSNFTTERTCMDTYYCWWQYSNWTNPGSGGTCKTPGEFNLTTNTSHLNDWNPACYVFDTNETDCLKVLGCSYSGGKCSSNSTIQTNGLACNNINDSALCNNIALLSSCCAWQGGTCQSDRFSQSCFKQMKEPPEGAKFCQDYNAYTTESLCNQITNSPWYMPCKWNNSSEICDVKTSDLFGNGTQSLLLIDNKNACERVNGRWVTENYCEGNVSVPTGRCEFKFEEERNCDKACYACEYQKDGSNWNSSTDAKSACVSSKRGYCEFTANANAPNGVGFCASKTQFKKGTTSGNCETDCGVCTYMGDPQAASVSKQPQEYCRNSNASCKWVVDNSTKLGGYCVSLSEKLCEDDCSKCGAQFDCQNKGRTSNNGTKGACTWDASKSICTKTGQTSEICWDAIDNDVDGLVDCSDPKCYTDSFCGFTTLNCYGWTTNATCASNDCEWINDTWGGWCDNYGGKCWKNDGNRTQCLASSNCQWTNGTGAAQGSCMQNWANATKCMAYTTNATCANNNCLWAKDTWCNGGGNGSDWCTNYGGWCSNPNFAPKNCYLYDGNQTGCTSINCTWKTLQQPYCSMDSSANCWLYTSNNTCSADSKCRWASYNWCTKKPERCYGQSQSDCQSDSLCKWRSEVWGGITNSWCDIKCNLPNHTSSTCTTDIGCSWYNGWCEEGGAGTLCNNYFNSSNCNSNSECIWQNPGWCDPKGFIGKGADVGQGGSSSGMQCFKYDGTNATACKAQTGCDWFTMPSPVCEADYSKDCWKYVNSGECNVSGCWWSATSNSCFPKADRCHIDPTLTTSAACNNTGNCTWSGFDCTSNCEVSNYATAAGCNSSIGCAWLTGLCDPAGMTKLFDTMEKGAPVPLGFDATGEIASQSVDMCGFGMKDMGDAYGFGASVFDGMGNASICNTKSLGGSKCPGGPVVSGQGSGNATVEFIVYLDTDGSTSGSCALDNNVTAVGYEFKFRSKSYWNNSKNNDLSNSYKCENGKWAGTDIKVNTWNQMVCSEIGGPMIAIEKSSLAKLPKLYDSSKDMRVYVVTVGNSSYNSSSPSDTIGPAWITPGSIDFKIDDMFGFGTDNAKFEDILKKGFVSYEDCYNSKDDNNNGYIDCYDYSCKYSSVCTSSGINAPGYSDTTSPQVVGVKIEEYTDAALIMYDTNKPTNGTILFYGKTDTTCSNESNVKKVDDIGSISTFVRDYKLWHTGIVDNNTVSGSNISMNQTYYYKLKVCDENNKCAISKCTSFNTPVSAQKCGYCNFVTRLKMPSGWIVKYDTNNDGIYEHVQGEVCGLNAGMKTNYTSGRRIALLLKSTDNTTEFKFINASLTKSALNDKVRSFSNSTSFKNGTTTDSSGNTVGYVGMIAETRDKIINNLHPEVCEIKIPGTGTCTQLWQCDDSLATCKDLTSSATLLSTGADYCVWRIPYCEFSIWAGGQPGTPSGGSGGTSGSGGGGSGGAGGLSTRQRALKVNEQMGFVVGGESHSLKLIKLTAEEATVLIQSVLIQSVFRQGEEKKFDLNEDYTYDILVKLLLINMTTQTATFNVNVISEVAPLSDITGAAGTEEEEMPEEEFGEEFQEVQQQITKKSRTGLMILLFVGIASLVIIGVLFKIKSSNDQKSTKRR